MLEYSLDALTSLDALAQVRCVLSSVVAPTQIDAPFAAGCDPGLFGYLLIEFLTLEPSFFALRFVICFRFAGSGVLRGWDESRAWVLWVLVRMLGALSVKSV